MLDLKLVNGHFRTMDPRHPVAYRLGVWQGRIVGLDEAITDLPARRELDLGGATVLPGFVDDHGVTLAGSSDRPVTEGAPLRGIQVMAERASSSGRSISPAEAMSVPAALHAYTQGAAYVCG